MFVRYLPPQCPNGRIGGFYADPEAQLALVETRDFESFGKCHNPLCITIPLSRVFNVLINP